MSVSGISANGYSDFSNQNTFQQLQQQFQQIGKDLQSGNLAAAQSDFVTLQQDLPQDSSSSSRGSNPIEQAFSQLLLIWLTQHTPMGSVEECQGRHFPRICGNSKATSLPKRPAKRTSRLAAGPRVSSVRAAQIGELMSW